MKQPARPLQVNNPYSNQKANKPGFLDFLNPFGEHGLFGTKQQQRFNNVTQPATKAIEDYQKNIDKGDNKPGFQWNDVGDYVRFAQKLPAGMVGGVLESPNKVAASVSGKHVDQTGKVSDKTLAQRAAMLADGYIGTAGLAMGASGKLLKSLGANLGKEAVKQTAKTGLKQGLKDFAKGVASEGLEEASQSLLGEIGERGYLDHQSLDRAIEAGKMGMLGGAIMDGAGKAISGVHSAYNNFKAPARPTLRRVDNPYSYQGSVRNKIDENWEKSRTPQQIALAEALDEAAGVKQPVSFGQLDAEKLKTLNELMLDRSQNIANSPDILVHPNVVAKLRNKRIIQEGLTPEQVADTAFSAIHNNDSRILPSKYPHIATIAKLKSGASPQANLGVYDDAISLKSVYDKNARAIVAEANKNLLPKAAGLSSLEGGTDPLIDLAPEDANGRAPISARQTTYNPNIPQNAKIVNPYSYDESTKLKQTDNLYGLSDEDLDFLKNSKNVRLGTDSPEMYMLKKRSGLSWNKLSQLQQQLIHNDPAVVQKAPEEAEAAKQAQAVEVDEAPEYPSYEQIKEKIRQNVVENAVHGEDEYVFYDSLDDFSDMIEDNPNLTKEQLDELTGSGWYDFITDLLYESGYGISSDGNFIVEKGQTTSFEDMNDYIETALEDLGLGDFETSRSWYQSEIPSRYATFAGETIRIANHDNGRVKRGSMDSKYDDANIQYDDETIATNKYTIDDIREDISEEMLKILGDYVFDSIEDYSSDDLIDPETRVEAFENLSSGLGQNRDSFDPENNTLTWYGQTLQLTEEDFDDGYDLEGKLLDFARDGIKNLTENLKEVRYKAQAEAGWLTTEIDKLKARHQNLTGDEDLVFGVYRNEIEKKASGYFDPATGKINLNQLSNDVLNHEIGHKIFARLPLEQKADLIAEVRKVYSDEALLATYKNYGSDLNLLAEERLADGFNDYFHGLLDGEDKVRLGSKLGIPPKILAYYDRLVEAIKSVFGMTDELRKFYAEIETGKFAEEQGETGLGQNGEASGVFGLKDELGSLQTRAKLALADSKATLADNYIQHQLKEQNQQRKANWRDKLRDIRAKFTHHLVDDAVAYDL